MLNATNMSCSGDEGQDLPKSIAILLSVVLSLIVLPSLYGIIWFERFGSDSKRTIINQLFASVCWYLMISVLCLQFPISFRIIFKEAYNPYVCALIDFLTATLYDVVLGKVFPVIFTKEYFNWFCSKKK